MANDKIDPELLSAIEAEAYKHEILGTAMYIRPTKTMHQQIKTIAKQTRQRDQIIVRAALRRGLQLIQAEAAAQQ